MENPKHRTEALFGENSSEILKSKTVALLGLGGVGSACLEALARSFIGEIIIVDSDNFDITNLNRQLLSNCENIGKSKCEEGEKRVKLISKETSVLSFKELYLPDNSDFLFKDENGNDRKIDFIVDAIDNMTAKLHLIKTAKEKNIPIISCLGTGARFMPEKLTIGKLSETAGSGCPLARIMRKELKKLGITDLDVVFSLEEATKSDGSKDENGKKIIPSSPFVPPVAGFILASFVVRHLLER